MNKFASIAQLTFVSLTLIAFANMAPAQRRFIKQTGGDLRFSLKLGNNILPLHLARVAGQALSRTSAPATGLKQIQVDLDWAANCRQFFDHILRTGGGQFSGAFLVGDRQVNFRNGLITETGIPACDGSSKDPAYLSLKMQVDVVDYREGGIANLPAQVQKRWLPSNFRLEIEGLDCTRVAKAGAFAGVRATAEARAGSGRVWGDPHVNELIIPKAAVVQARWTPNFQGAEFDAGKQSFRPRTGRIHFLAETGGTLATLNFRVMRLGKVKSTEGGFVKVEMYCEALSLR